jgi:Flp pilus assembly protein TadG
MFKSNKHQGGARRRRAPLLRSERGAATAEFAAMLPLIVGVVLGVVWVFALALTQMQITEAAREVARAAARGDEDPQAVGRLVVPEGAEITISDAAGAVTVTVTTEFQGPGGLFAIIPGPELSAVSVAASEAP